jgi:gluconolactonase
MIAPPLCLEARCWTRLPPALRWSGQANAWTRSTRPGQRLHSFLEGPAFDKDGSLLLADVPYGRIFRVDADGRWSVALQYPGLPHAIRPLPEQRFAIADVEQGLLTVDLRSGTFETLAGRAGGEAFRGLSDLCVAASGDIWFTDCGRSSLSDPSGRLFCLRADGRLEQALGNAPYPNGVALSADGEHVYVAMTRSNAIWSLRSRAGDTALPMAGLWIQLSGGLGPDGLAVDHHGRLAVAQAQAGRAYLFSPLGDPLAVISTPGGLWTTAVAFAPDADALLIVEAQTGGIYRIDLSGVPKT